MDNFKVIYKILKILEGAMDVQDFDESMLSPDMFKISQTRLDAILVMLQNDGYISGLIPVRFGRVTGVKFDNVRITLKGLEYLAENSFMKKAANIAADLIPYQKTEDKAMINNAYQMREPDGVMVLTVNGLVAAIIKSFTFTAEPQQDNIHAKYMWYLTLRGTPAFDQRVKEEIIKDISHARLPDFTFTGSFKTKAGVTVSIIFERCIPRNNNLDDFILDGKACAWEFEINTLPDIAYSSRTGVHHFGQF